jgi:DNA-binding transcriptional regulator YhcF (GntR family)
MPARALLAARYIAKLPSFPNARPALRALALEVGCSMDQTRRCMRELERRGLLLRRARHGAFGEQRSNEYTALDGAAFAWFLDDQTGRNEAAQVVAALLKATGCFDVSHNPPLADMPGGPLQGCQAFLEADLGNGAEDLRAAQEACQDLAATLAALDGASPLELSVSQAQPENGQQQQSSDETGQPDAHEETVAPSTPRSRPALASSGPAKVREASLSQPTLLGLIAALGTDTVRLLELAFCHPRWRAPGVAESACQMLLQRMRRKRVNHPVQYVEQLYADALERAPQCAELLERERRASLSPRRGPHVSTA